VAPTVRSVEPRRRRELSSPSAPLLPLAPPPFLSFITSPFTTLGVASTTTGGEQNAFLSKLLLCLGTFVVVCLLLF
ncbi:hypothetical protein TeGR_g12263, partial [Tetraparma gracilis]